MSEFSPLWIVPFVLILLCIALLPLFFPHFWERNRNKGIVCIGLALPTFFFLVEHAPDQLAHVAHEYFSFVSLLIALFVITGGILVEGDLRATPSTNTLMLLIGSSLASIIGTTGASMLLIRPLLRTNQERKRVKHIPLFFIFTVSNIGGLLTPIGDPPLFLGYLRGVPFFWTLKLFPIWVFSIGILLALFYIVDRRAYALETQQDLQVDQLHRSPLKIKGAFNIPILLLAVSAVFLPSPYRELTMLILAGLSLKTTPRQLRHANSFSFHPLNEVALIFAGIFIAMVPALELLKLHGPEFGITAPGQFFWLTGLLSAFLDNAPTYLTFLSLGQGLNLPGATVIGLTEPILAAISAGAVLMGALTYIGNGPNFMVKAIADEMGLRTPSFFAYLGIATVILMPIFLVVQNLFL